jgi:hypothetical protein
LLVGDHTAEASPAEKPKRKRERRKPKKEEVSAPDQTA